MTLRSIDQYRETSFLNINERTYEPLEVLDVFIGRLWEPSQSLNRWEHLAFLEVDDIVITRPLLLSIIDLLELPLAKDPSRGDSQEEFPWISITLAYCQLAHTDLNLDYERDYCEVEDLPRLFSAMTTRTLQIRIYGCFLFLIEFLNMDHQDDRLEVEALTIHESSELIDRQYAKLGDMIQNSRSLRAIELWLAFVEDALGLFEGLANAVNIEELSLKDARKPEHQTYHLVDDLVVGQDGGDGPIMRFLHNPQNSLKSLSLKNMGLEDSHLVAVLQAIPTDRIEQLDFSDNLIELQGMLEFANLLPKMTALRSCSFESNSWQDSSMSHDKFGRDLLQGLMENTSIRHIRGIQCLPQLPQLWHYLAMNCAGRRVLTFSEPIADGLWPLVLKRAQKRGLYDCLWIYGGIKECNGMASAIYFFLRNCPEILSFHGL